LVLPSLRSEQPRKFFRARAVLASLFGAGTSSGREGWLTGVLVAATVFMLGLTPIADGDIFWHLTAGREMVRLRAWLHVDSFTVSAAGRPWTDVHWLFQLGAYAVHRAGGLRALVIVKAAVLAIGAVLFTETAARAATTISAPLAGEGAAKVPPAAARARATEGHARALCGATLIAALALARHLLPVRPSLITLLMLAIFVAVLESCRRRGGRPWRRLGLLPALQIVWTNCQGLSILGPVVIGAYLLPAAILQRGSRQRAPNRQSSRPPAEESSFPVRAGAMALGLCLLAALATPYGMAAVVLPVRLLLRLIPAPENVFSAQVAENVSPLRLEASLPDQAAHFRVYLVALLAGLIYARRQLPAAHALLVLSFGALALVATRNVPLFYWMATPLTAMAISRQIDLSPSRRPGLRIGARALMATVFAGELAFAALAAAREPSIADPAPFHFPVESVAVLSRAGASGPIFAPDHQGGYLEFAVPRLQPYLDTRLVLHSAEEYAFYLDVVDRPSHFDGLADRCGFRYVVLTTAYPDRYLDLVRHLAISPAWRLIFTDGSEVLFAHGGPAPALLMDKRSTTVAILDSLATRFRAQPRLWAAARLQLARLHIVLGAPREALYVLGTLDDETALQLRARAYLVAGEAAAAAGLALIMLAHDPRDVRSLVLLAQIQLAAGDAPGAWRWLRQALAAEPYDPEARALLTRLEADAHPP
jgi:hypothetical protein